MALWQSTLILLLSTLCISSSTLAHEPKSAVAAQGHSRDPVPLYDDLGDLTYPIRTANELAQRYFDQGLRLTYAFNHAEARRAFHAAQRHDPSCAMCYWGEAFV